MSVAANESKAHDEEKGPLLVEGTLETPLKPSGLSHRFWLSAIANCIATTGIVFVNKRIFEDEALRHCQVTFVALHFTITAALLYTASRPAVDMFRAKPVEVLKILPLSIAMICNVVLPNASLAYSSIQFYQICRALLTPCVAFLNYVILRATIPTPAALALIPVCVGVAMVSYFDTAAKGGTTSHGTTPIGVFFAFAGVFASSIYTVWIARYHKLLECSSMQLLLNQAPLSVVVMVYIIPFSDNITGLKDTPAPTWVLIGLSGVCACFISISQFIIINEAGPVSSTVIGHAKTIMIVALGWIYSGRSIKDWTLVGVMVTIAGILSYSAIMHRHSRK